MKFSIDSLFSSLISNLTNKFCELFWMLYELFNNYYYSKFNRYVSFAIFLCECDFSYKFEASYLI